MNLEVLWRSGVRMNSISALSNIDSAPYSRIQDYLDDELARLNLFIARTAGSDRGAIDKEIDLAAEKIESRSNPNSGNCFPIPLLSLLSRLNLSREARDYVLLCLASSIDAGYVDGLAAISSGRGSDVTPALIATVFEGKSEEWAKFCFGKNPFFENDLLYYDADSAYNQSELLRPIRVHQRFLSYIFGVDCIDTKIEPYLQIESLDAIVEPAKFETPELAQKLESLTSYLQSSSGAQLMHFSGPDGVGKAAAARRICAAIDMPLLSVDGRALIAQPVMLNDTIRRVAREVFLRDAALRISDWHLISEHPELDQEDVLRCLRSVDNLLFLISEAGPALPIKAHRVIRVEFPENSSASRRASWESNLNGSLSADSTVDLHAVAGAYKFNDGQIKTIVEHVETRSAALQDGAALSHEDILAGCREAGNQKLAELAKKVSPFGDWNFLILPENQKNQLRDVCNHMKYRSRVYEEWDYQSQVSAPGLNALFSGSPGTGKTLAASIVAKELGLDLYKIDLSSIVSKYIGETEKNLSRIFREAETSNAILFFDEADSLFGKRSEVRDAHDRYANIQVGYLLQKMEDFSGMTILATNLSENVDEAFMRRLHFAIDFPFPGAEEREAIWRKSFPNSAPVAEDVDFATLGRKLKVPGGNIRNIALHAAFFAAAENDSIRMKYILRAARHEFEKEGRPADAFMNTLEQEGEDHV